MKQLIVLFGLLGVVSGSAAEVRWTARGTVSSVSGTSFSGTGTTVGNEVVIEMVYDSNASVSPRSYLPIGASTSGQAWFYGNVNLGISIGIGANTWSGAMATIPTNTNVMDSNCWDGGGNPDIFKVTLDAARGGTFPSFPQNGVETTRALKLEFRDDTTPAQLFDVHVLPSSVTNVCEMTSAKGSVVVGSSTIAFTIDPASVRVTLPQVPVTIAQTGGGIELGWQSESGKVYRIEGSSDLKCWSNEGIAFGNGDKLQEALTPFGSYSKRFYRIVEL